MTSIPSDLDHIVLAGPVLADVVGDFERLTGVRAAPGGRHPTGTENHLVAFTLGGQRTSHYLELIGPQEGIDPAEVDTFAINTRTEPGVATFAIHPADVDATFAKASHEGIQLGEITPLSRRTPDGTLLQWRISGGPARDRDPAIPFLIDWADTPHPGRSTEPTIELVSLRVTHPDPDAIRRAYSSLGIQVDVGEGSHVAISFSVVGKAGEVVEFS